MVSALSSASFFSEQL